ncbi:MAG TPA: TIGR00730 family Rossman fold protein [Clostridiaceae bacterium]|nr:TIGR00730 family Rossman fold protein [Clostridiaceae bacterium]
MNKTICVYSSSSCAIDKVYFDAARKLGREIAIRNDIFLYGGGLTGLMGAVAEAVHNNNGKVIGVIPEALNVKGIVYESCDELIITKDMRTRKAKMDSLSEAFIALPGGYGTLEELLEIITLKQLHYHCKPIVILNINNFYDKLIEFFEQIITLKFAKRECSTLYFTTNDIKEALDYIDSYTPSMPSSKWLTDVDV